MLCQWCSHEHEGIPPELLAAGHPWATSYYVKGFKFKDTSAGEDQVLVDEEAFDFSSLYAKAEALGLPGGVSWVEVTLPTNDPEAGVYRVREISRRWHMVVEVEQLLGEGKWVPVMNSSGLCDKIHKEAKDSGLL